MNIQFCFCQSKNISHLIKLRFAISTEKNIAKLHQTGSIFELRASLSVSLSISPSPFTLIACTNNTHAIVWRSICNVIQMIPFDIYIKKSGPCQADNSLWSAYFIEYLLWHSSVLWCMRCMLIFQSVQSFSIKMFSLFSDIQIWHSKLCCQSQPCVFLTHFLTK